MLDGGEAEITEIQFGDRKVEEILLEGTASMEI